MRTRNLAIVFTDIAGFTARTARQTHEENRRLLRAHDLLLKPVFRSFGGRVVKAIGDAFLVVFPSPTDAVFCGTAIQDRLWEWNRRAPEDLRLHVRVAVNVGEVRLEKSDVFGAPVNLASRVEALAQPGEVLLTEAVWRAIEPGRLAARDLGLKELRGVPEPVRLYSVEHLDGASSPPYSGLGRRNFGSLPDLDEAGLRRTFTRRVRSLGTAAALAILAVVFAGRSLRARPVADGSDSNAVARGALPAAPLLAVSFESAHAAAADQASDASGSSALASGEAAGAADSSGPTISDGLTRLAPKANAKAAGAVGKNQRRGPGALVTTVSRPRRDLAEAPAGSPGPRAPAGSRASADKKSASTARPKHGAKSSGTRLAAAPARPISPAAAAAFREGTASETRRDWQAAATNFEQAARAGDDRGRDQLLAMLGKPWCKARLHAAESLGRLGDVAAAAKLKGLIAERDLPDEGSGLTMFDCSSKRAASDALDRLSARASR